MGGLLARVYVTPKRGILDPQGKAVRVGKYIEVQLRDVAGDAAMARVRQMCERLLANGVIEDFRVELGEGRS